MAKKIYLNGWVKPMAEEHAHAYCQDVLGLSESDKKYQKEFDKAVQEFCKEFYENALIPHAANPLKKSNPIISAYSRYEDYSALGSLIYVFKNMIVCLQKDWNWYDTREEQAKVIGEIEETISCMESLLNIWPKYAEKVQLEKKPLFLEQFIKCKTLETLLSYELLIKAQDKSGKPLIKAKSKAAQNRLAGLWDECRSIIYHLLKFLKE